MMLAPDKVFLTPQELRITQRQHDALQQVMRGLEDGSIPFKPGNAYVYQKYDGSVRPDGFNISQVYGRSECGTIGCIAGWARYFSGGEDEMEIVHVPSPLSELFMPPKFQDGLITPEQAAHAIRTFLQTGWPEWK